VPFAAREFPAEPAGRLRHTAGVVPLRTLWWFWLLVAAPWACTPVASPPAVERMAAVAAAPAVDAERAAKLLLAALDGEALYTLADGTKPVSEGFWHGWVRVDAPDLAEVEAVRAALAPLRTDDLYADVTVFDAVHDGKRAAQAFVVDRRALAAALTKHAAFFAPYGLAPSAHPCEVMAVVERMPKLDRHRGHGLLFGYPVHAVDFFVAVADTPGEGGKPAPRRFVQIPTFASPTGRFVYAVPPDAPDRPEDVALRARTEPVLARWRELRAGLAVDDVAALRAAVATLRRECAGRAAVGVAGNQSAAALRPLAFAEGWPH
jgi:hypothetical protein